ncbi:hypothetical protein Daesc_007613 [Daldinia eschscholtzii]|uniref:Uncharacterized protein n=1 Tax=Daldinia eschscholtzii TaxID=292717 RepID=A0AAX6MF07_9PEZI
MSGDKPLMDRSPSRTAANASEQRFDDSRQAQSAGPTERATEKRRGQSGPVRAVRDGLFESRLEGCYPAGRVHGQYTMVENGKDSGAKKVSTCSARIDYVATRSRGRASGSSIDITIPFRCPLAADRVQPDSQTPLTTPAGNAPGSAFSGWKQCCRDKNWQNSTTQSGN